ncbi:DVU3141 family protein [Halomonas sp. CSM-2]|uniref:DVU3141 family protein n=1 Tax=Halomonas sp. CSM-2 TaxID=1975722 RepID=UPI000A282001|nr:DVU3141 family protein [Halomonas sp. CSM-2]
MTYEFSRRIAGGKSLLLGALFLATLSGCALQPASQNNAASGSVVAGSEQGKPVDANLNGFLAQSNLGETLQLERSPWGNNVNVTADAPYFSASGRVCRKLTVQQVGRNDDQAAIACETANGSWAVRRQVTKALSNGGAL